MSVRTIPGFLAHLRTDRRGLPVPYVNRWGREDTARLSVRIDPWIGERAVFHDDSSESEPDFTAQDEARQREIVWRGLCQVCARPIPWSRRFLVVSDISVEHRHLGMVTLTEPWLDARCLDFAVASCPALIRRRRGEDLRVLPVTSRRQVKLGYSWGWLEGPLEAETRAAPVVLWADVSVPGAALREAVTVKAVVASS